MMNGDTMTACAEVARCHGSTYGSQPRSVNSLSTAGCPLPHPGRGCCAHSPARCAAAADVASLNLRRHTERQHPHVAPRSICAPARQRTGEHPSLVGSGARHVPLLVAGSTMDATRQSRHNPAPRCSPLSTGCVAGRPAHTQHTTMTAWHGCGMLCQRGVMCICKHGGVFGAHDAAEYADTLAHYRVEALLYRHANARAF